MKFPNNRTQCKLIETDTSIANIATITNSLYLQSGKFPAFVLRSNWSEQFI